MKERMTEKRYGMNMIVFLKTNKQKLVDCRKSLGQNNLLIVMKHKIIILNYLF